MKKVQLGQSDLQVAQIGLGAMGMSEFYGEADEKNSIALLQEFLELGGNFVDTADIYGVGHNEELLAKAYHDRRDQVIIATKFGILRDGKTGAWLGLSGKADYVKQACEASLKRLKTDVIDLYYLHRLDPQTPIEETVGAMAELVEEGKVRYLGLSEVGAETLAKAHAVHPITAVQSEYSLWSRDIEKTSIPFCKENGISLVPYSPLGRGFLTGKIKNLDDLDEKDYRRVSPRFQGENLQKNLDLVKMVEEVASSKNATSAQIALAWVLAKGESFVPIPGTKRRKYLIDNLGAANVLLEKDEIEKLDRLSDLVQGDRYDERGMSLVNA